MKLSEYFIGRNALIRMNYGFSLHAQSLFIKFAFLFLCLGSIVNACTCVQFFPWIIIPYLQSSGVPYLG